MDGFPFPSRNNFEPAFMSLSVSASTANPRTFSFNCFAVFSGTGLWFHYFKWFRNNFFLKRFPFFKSFSCNVVGTLYFGRASWAFFKRKKIAPTMKRYET